MNGRRGLLLAFLLAISSLLAFTGARNAQPDEASGEGKGPNVLLIVVDTLRQDHLGCYGYRWNTSPNIDQLAAEGIQYMNCFSQAPWTTPSVASMLTSQYPSEIGIGQTYSLEFIVPDQMVFLAEVLKEHGYYTGAVVSHSLIGADRGFSQGCDYFTRVGKSVTTSPEVTRRAVAFLEGAAGKENPFFLLVHYFDPHFEYVSHEGFDFNPDPAYNGEVFSGMPMGKLRDGKDSYDEADVAQIIAHYDSEIGFTDRHIGILLDRMRALGTYGDTLIVFTADHGEEFLERRDIGHTYTVFNEVIRVPLIFKYPSAAAPDISKKPGGYVACLDIFPTVLDYLGLSVEHALSGRSLLLEGPAGQDVGQPVFSETTTLTRGVAQTVLQDGLKLILDFWPGVKPKTYRLFDLTEDPGELHDISGQRPEEVAALKKKLDAWSTYCASEFAKVADKQRKSELSEEEKAKLEALGYIE